MEEVGTMMVEGVAFGEGEGGMDEVHQVFVWSDFL